MNIEDRIREIALEVYRAQIKDDCGDPTVEAPSLPDPGAGWRLIDKEKDTPMEGDEVWIRDEEEWISRTYCNEPFRKNYKYRRRIETPKIVPDPGEGWRLVDTSKEKPQKGIEFWDQEDQCWTIRSCYANKFAEDRIYRIRISKDPEYREPTNDDIGKMVEVRNANYRWVPGKLCCILDSSYYERFAVERTGNCFTFQQARIRVNEEVNNGTQR